MWPAPAQAGHTSYAPFVVEEGRQAPDFELRSDTGETVRLSDLRGRPVVLYFYPKDDTPGCTTEACEFRDAYDVFRERGAEVLGVSPDDVASHEKFRTKYELLNRSTFIIDQNGNVARAMMGIKPAGHAAQVLDSLP